VTGQPWYAMTDEQARIFSEAAVGLGRAAQALPFNGLRDWLQTEYALLLKGNEGVTGGDPRQVAQLLLIVETLDLLGNRIEGFDQITESLEPSSAELQAEGAEQMREAQREEIASYGDRRDEPVPDDWAV
jgi:hypothetical protein